MVIGTMVKVRRDILLFVLLTSVIPVILLCVLYPTRLESRYLSFLMPPLFIFAATGFSRLKYFGIAMIIPFTVFQLTFTLKTIAMPWDPIHREDYRVAINYTFKTADENDAVCGSDRQVLYYGPKEKKAQYYLSVKKAPLKQNRYKRIFLLEPSLYVAPNKDHKRLDSMVNLLGGFGYRLKRSLDFGKDGVYTFVHIFESQI